MKPLKLNKLKFEWKYFFIILGLVVILISCIFIYRNYKKNMIIPENKKTLKFTVKPGMFDDHNDIDIDMLFEEADLEYYKTIPVPLHETIVFHPAETPTETPTETERFDNRDGQTRPVLPQVEIPNVDSQSVHDSGVNKFVRKIFSNFKLYKKEDFKINDLLNDIKNYVYNNKDKKDNEKNNIIKVLNTIKARNATISNLDLATESELLATVWYESKNNENIKDMLLTQLSDTVEKDTVLCPSGFSNRLAVALTVEEPENYPRTKKMLADEMLVAAAFTRTELEKDPDYNTLDDSSQNNEFKNKLNQKLENDYAGILDKDEIQDMIKPWIDHI